MPVHARPRLDRAAAGLRAALAESLGCAGVRAESVATLEKALSAAFAGRARPLVIEARIDPSQYAAQF